VKYVTDFKEKLFTEKIILKYKNNVVFNLAKLKYISDYDGVNI
jgi:hypothetical protein